MHMAVMIRSITEIGNYRNYNDDSCNVFKSHFIGIRQETYKEDLTDLFSICNDEIISEAKRKPAYAEMGTTLTVICFDVSRYYIAHIGDSRAYLFRKGKLTRLTEDHNIVGELLRSGQISKRDAQHHPGKNMLTKVIGRKPLSEISFYSGKIMKDDLFLLCTDGMSGYLDDKRITTVIKYNNSLEQILNQLVEKVLDRDGKDNITAILAKII